MKSPYMYFVDEFRLRIFLRLRSAPGAYQRFREDILPRISSSSLHYWSEYFLTAWRRQIPSHQEQYLQLKTAQVPFRYYEFLINQFDDWFAHHHQDIASGNSGSFFCLQNYLTKIQGFGYLFILLGQDDTSHK